MTDEKNMLNDLETLLKAYASFKTTHNFDPFRNQKYREYLMADLLKKVDETIQLNSDKVDFISLSIKNGEMKSCKVDKLKTNLYSMSSGFEFDKQNDPIRRENTLKYDAFSFGLFDSETEEIVGTLFIKDIDGVSFINNLLKQKQDSFLEKMEESNKAGKQLSRDSIQLSLKDIVECPNTIFITKNNLISKDEFLSLFNQIKKVA